MSYAICKQLGEYKTWWDGAAWVGDRSDAFEFTSRDDAERIMLALQEHVYVALEVVPSSEPTR